MDINKPTRNTTILVNEQLLKEFSYNPNKHHEMNKSIPFFYGRVESLICSEDLAL